METRTKVLHIITTLNRGGAENVAVNMFRLADKNRVVCDYVVYVDEGLDYKPEIEEMGGKVYCLPHPHKNYFLWKKEMKKIMVEKGPYDVVHSHSLFHSGQVLAVAKKVGIKKRIAHAHTTSSSYEVPVLKKIYDAYMRNLILKNATHLVACGVEAGNYLYGEKVFSKQGIIINNDIDLKKFSFKENIRKKYRADLGVGEEFVLLNVGRLFPVKNQLFLVEIMKVLENSNKDIKLLIVGTGDLEEELQEKIASYKLENRVKLLGNRNDVYNLLNVADLFLMPSKFEGLPLALIEAQANGLPIIASDRISKESNITGLVEFLTIDNGPETWAECILSHLEDGRKDTATIIKQKKYDTESNSVIINKLYE